MMDDKDHERALELLKAAPPQRSIDDQRYQSWRARVDAFLASVASAR